MKNKQTYEEAVLKTVMWWSDKSFRTPLNQNNGDDSPNGGMMFALMNRVAMNAQSTVTKEKQKAFESKLSQLLMNCHKYDRQLSVDYHPCKLLSEDATFAGIDGACFPCKSHTYIDDNNNVFAKYGYGRETIKI